MSEKLRRLLGKHANAYPHQLAEKYIRIVEKITELWGTEAIEGYFNQLLIAEHDTARGSRAGFPADVASEIFKLMMAYDAIQRGDVEEGGDAWEDVKQAKKELENAGFKMTPEDFRKAIELDQPDKVELLLKAGMKVDTEDALKWTPLVVAAFEGNPRIAKLLINRGANIHHRDKHGYTPLHWASLNGFTEVVDLLLEKGANSDAPSETGFTPMMQAASKGHVRVMMRLMMAGADKNTTNNEGWTALHKAIANRKEAAAKILIENGAKVNIKSNDGSTAMTLAKKNKLMDLAKLISTKKD